MSGETQMSPSPEIISTRPLTPPPESAIDPLVEEASWVAWRLESASHRRVTSEASVRAAASLFDRVVESTWVPGRTVVFTEACTSLEAGIPQLHMALVVGLLGPAGATRAEADAVGALVDRRIHAVRLPYAAARVDAGPLLDVPYDELSHSALIRQRTVTLEGDETERDVEVLSRFNPTVAPWTAVATALLTRASPTRVRTTVLATEVTVTDRRLLADSVARAERMRRLAEDRPDLRTHAERAVATLVDLRASFATPVLCCEVAVTSSDALPEVFVRSVGSCFTSEVDVFRGEGRTFVAAQRLMIGGFEVDRQPPGLAEAHRTGVPLRGGLAQRELADLITLFESPIGWPIPVNGPVPTVPSGARHDLAVPPGLQTGMRIGVGQGGTPVHLPDDARDRHTLVLGVSGTGKTTVLVASAVDDLSRGRSFVFICPHGDAADRLVGEAQERDIDVAVVDARDRDTTVLGLLPSLHANGMNLAEVEEAATGYCDAVVSTLANKEWAGPRFYRLSTHTLVLAAVHGVAVVDVLAWVNDRAALSDALEHPAVPVATANALRDLHATTHSDSASVREWFTAKFRAFESVNARRIIASAGHGTPVPELVDSGVPIIVNLAAFSRSDAAVLGTVVLDAVLRAAMARPAHQRHPMTAYVDEAHRFPAASLASVQAEGRKFGLSLALATQSMMLLDDVLADIAGSAAIQIGFRQTSDSATRSAALMDLDTADLIDLPDLHGFVKVAGLAPCTVSVDPYRDLNPPRSKAAPPRGQPLLPTPTSPQREAVSRIEPTPPPPDEPDESFLTSWRARQAGT